MNIIDALVSAKKFEKELDRLKDVVNESNKSIAENLEKLGRKYKAKDIIMQALYIKKHEANVLTSIVNEGLKFSYPDKDLNFSMKFEEKYGKVVPEFYLNELELKPPFVGDGGGIISMIGILLYVAMVKLKNIKIVLLDEVDAMIDMSAATNLFAFLDAFANDNDIVILAITHKKLPFSREEKISKKITIGGV